MRPVKTSWLTILAFIAIYFVWGTTYLANLFALKGFPPFAVSFFRYSIAGILLTAWVLIKQFAWPDRRTIKVLCISGIMMLVGGSGMIVFAEQYINSGYAAALIATEPLFFILLDKGRWQLYFSNRLIPAGLVIGFIGMVLFACFAAGQTPNNTSHPILGTVIVLVSAILWVLGTLYANKNLQPGGSTIVNTTVQLLAAGLFSGLIALCRGEWTRFDISAVSLQAWEGLLYLIVMGSLIAYLAFTWLITVQPPAIVSTHTYVNPVVAIIMGWLLADEQILSKQIVALAIAFSGVVLAQLGKSKLNKPKSYS